MNRGGSLQGVGLVVEAIKNQLGKEMRYIFQNKNYGDRITVSYIKGTLKGFQIEVNRAFNTKSLNKVVAALDWSNIELTTDALAQLNFELVESTTPEVAKEKETPATITQWLRQCQERQLNYQLTRQESGILINLARLTRTLPG